MATQPSGMFRRLACALPGTEEGAHMGHADFRVHGKIFATLYGIERGRGVLKLTPEQQADFVAEMPGVFEPVQGAWGRSGMTYLRLDHADEETMRGALTTAHRNVAAKPAASKKAARKTAKTARRKTA
jgi:hypothetical protein